MQEVLLIISDIFLLSVKLFLKCDNKEIKEKENQSLTC